MLDSRGSADAVRRRRECLDCGRRFTTYERLAESEIRVVKRAGETVAFDRDKLERVVRKVTRGRPVTDKSCHDLVRGLEAELVDVGAQTVTSAQVAEKLLARLRALDTLAAARFAANFQQDDGTLRFADEAPSPQLPLLIPPAPEPAPEPPAGRGRGRKRGG